MNIYVGNLSTQATGDALGREFKAFGDVTSVTLARGKDFGNPIGHGFVEMPSVLEGTAAITALNNEMFMNNRINVIQALPLSHGAGDAFNKSGDKPRRGFGSLARQ